MKDNANIKVSEGYKLEKASTAYALYNPPLYYQISGNNHDFGFEQGDKNIKLKIIGGTLQYLITFEKFNSGINECTVRFYKNANTNNDFENAWSDVESLDGKQWYILLNIPESKINDSKWGGGDLVLQANNPQQTIIHINITK